MITTTLNRIREHGPCPDGWGKLLRHLGKTQADDEPLPFAVIVKSNGLDDALWCCRAEPQHAKEWRLFAVRCARSVQHLMTDPRSIAAIDVAERYANGQAMDQELAAAAAAARAAPWDAAWDAAWGGLPDGERAAAWNAAWDAARAAARAAVLDAASLVTAQCRGAERAAERAAMTEDFLRIVGEEV